MNVASRQKLDPTCAWTMTRPCWATYFQVDQLGMSTQKALQLGGKRWAGPIDLPGIGTFTLITDPTGAMLALFQPPAAPA